MRKIYLVGGGTGGHCLPMLTTYRFFKKKKLNVRLLQMKEEESFLIRFQKRIKKY
jgi:UDP-N-acetylglucosamine:LPS N-acetylglucosamine transferase